jgi:hypothetical protein
VFPNCPRASPSNSNSSQRLNPSSPLTNLLTNYAELHWLTNCSLQLVPLVSILFAQNTQILIVVVQSFPWKHVRFRNRYSATALVYLLISLSLPSNGSTCYIIILIVVLVAVASLHLLLLLMILFTLWKHYYGRRPFSRNGCWECTYAAASKKAHHWIWAQDSSVLLASSQIISLRSRLVFVFFHPRSFSTVWIILWNIPDENRIWILLLHHVNYITQSSRLSLILSL